MAKKESRSRYLRRCYALFSAWCKKKHRSCGEREFIDWDDKENGRQALNWDNDYNFQRGLWEQAHIVVTLYGRTEVTYDNKILSYPGSLGGEKRSYGGAIPERTFVEDLTRAQLSAVISDWTREIAIRWIRIRHMAHKAGIPLRANRVMEDIAAAIREADSQWRREQRVKKPPTSKGKKGIAVAAN